MPAGSASDQSDRAMSAVKAALGQEGFDREVGRGRALALDETVELARELARLAESREITGRWLRTRPDDGRSKIYG